MAQVGGVDSWKLFIFNRISKHPQSNGHISWNIWMQSLCGHPGSGTQQLWCPLINFVTIMEAYKVGFSYHGWRLSPLWRCGLQSCCLVGSICPVFEVNLVPVQDNYNWKRDRFAWLKVGFLLPPFPLYVCLSSLKSYITKCWCTTPRLSSQRGDIRWPPSESKLALPPLTPTMSHYQQPRSSLQGQTSATLPPTSSISHSCTHELTGVHKHTHLGMFSLSLTLWV